MFGKYRRGVVACMYKIAIISLQSCFENIVKKHIPSRTVEIRPKDKPWFTSEIRKAIRNKNRLLKYIGLKKPPSHGKDIKLKETAQHH
jgi:hypothetical protein